jgi:hypothetical protein
MLQCIFESLIKFEHFTHMAYKINENHGQQVCPYFPKYIYIHLISPSKKFPMSYTRLSQMICIDLVMPKVAYFYQD